MVSSCASCTSRSTAILPEKMERGLTVSLAIRHLPALVAAFGEAEQQARVRGLTGGGSNRYRP
jgi:hypothetical protein